MAQPQYVHYTGPPGTKPTITPAVPAPPPAAASQTISYQHAAAASTSGGSPVVATGDWTTDLVKLAKNAELKRHSLTLQLHTAHILSAHAQLEQKGKQMEELKVKKLKLEDDRAKLLERLSQVNKERDEVDLSMGNIEKESATLRDKIVSLTDGDYAVAKRDVDKLRDELGEPPIDSLQTTLVMRSQQTTPKRPAPPVGTKFVIAKTPATATSPTTPTTKTAATGPAEGEPAPKRQRGRPKGSKNKAKTGEGEGTGT